MAIEPIVNLESGLSVRGKLNTLIALSETLETEVAQSLTNDDNLSDALDEETLAREAADTVLQELIDDLEGETLNLSTAVTDEVVARIAADSALEGMINSLEEAVDVAYYTREEATEATISADVKRIFVFHDNTWLEYKQDTNGTALATNPTLVEGVTTYNLKWSPSGTPTVRHWGAVGSATMALNGTVAGTDCTSQAQAMLDWAQTFRSAGVERAGAIPVMEWGQGNFKVSGSLNLTIFNTNERMVKLTGYGTTIYADGENSRVFDLTDAQYIELSGFTIIGSAATTPLCAVKTGRKANNDGAAYVTLRDIRTRAGTNAAAVRSCFKVATLWQMASETSHEINCVWENFYGPSGSLTSGITDTATTLTLDAVAGFPSSGLVRVDREKIRYTSITGTTLNGLTRGVDGSTAASHLTGAAVSVCNMGYAAAYDNVNALSYAEPVPLTSFVAGTPAVFTSVGHGFSNGDKVVATVTSVTTLRNIGTQYNIEGKALTVGSVTTNTFTLSYNGVALTNVFDENDAPAAIPADTRLAKELIAPSTFIGDVRAEPFKRHSQLHNLRESITYFSNVGRAGVMVGCSEGNQFRDCFIVGKTGYHMLYTQQRSTNDLHWGQCNFGDHLEGGGTIGDVEDWMLVAPAMSYAGTVARFNKCKFWDNAMQAQYMVNQTSGVDIQFVDCDFSVARSPFSFLAFAKAPADVFIFGGIVGMGDLTDFNIPSTNKSCTVVNYDTGEFSLPGASYETLSNTANSTVSASALGKTINDTTSLTANVTRSLLQTGASAGSFIRIMRTGSNGAFTFTVRDQASATNLATLATGQWIDCIYNGTTWVVEATASFETVSNTANSTVSASASGKTINDTTSLTGNTTRSLLQTGAVAGSFVRIMRTGLNNGFTFTVRDQTSATNLIVLQTGQWADCVYDGTTWRVAADDFAVIQTENFNSVTRNNRIHRNVTTSTTGTPTPTANWHMVNWDADNGAGTAEQLAIRNGLQVLRNRAGGTLGVWKQPNSAPGTITANAAIVVTWLTTGQILRDTATLTANRDRLLFADNVPTGATITVTRTGGGAFTSNILNGGPALGTLKTLATNEWADFHFDGTDWRLIRFGSL